MGLVSFGRLIRSFVLENISLCLYPPMDSQDTIILVGVQSFDDCELEEATNNFDPSRKLGTGGYSTVYHGILKDGRAVAIKKLQKSSRDEMDKCKILRAFKNELAVLSRLNHENLVTLYGCSTLENLNRLLIVQEYVSNGSLADHLHGARKKAGALPSVPWAARLNIAIQTAAALDYLHGCRIVHRDVKTSNILVDYRFNAKVTDFGLSRLFPEDVSYVSTKLAGSCGYIDPQYNQSFHLSPKSDVYSFGVVMIELISSKPATCVDGLLSTFAVNKIMNKEIHQLVDPSLGFEQTWNNRAILAVSELAFRCLQHERYLRPSMAEVLDTLESIRDGTAMIPLAWNGGTGHKVTNSNVHIVSRLPDTFFDK